MSLSRSNCRHKGTLRIIAAATIRPGSQRLVVLSTFCVEGREQSTSNHELTQDAIHGILQSQFQCTEWEICCVHFWSATFLVLTNANRKCWRITMFDHNAFRDLSISQRIYVQLNVRIFLSSFGLTSVRHTLHRHTRTQNAAISPIQVLYFVVVLPFGYMFSFKLNSTLLALKRTCSYVYFLERK